MWDACRAKVECKTHAKKTSWIKQYKQLAMAKCRLAGAPIVLYTKPGVQDNTEMMLVVMTGTCKVIGALNTYSVMAVETHLP